MLSTIIQQPGGQDLLFATTCNCAAPSVGGREMLPIAPGDSFRLDVHFLTNGFTGDGSVEILVWDVSDSANSVQR